MTERTRVENQLIEACRDRLGVMAEFDPDSDAMAEEIAFARRVLGEWETLGAKEAFSRAAAFLEVGERWRTERESSAVSTAN